MCKLAAYSSCGSSTGGYLHNNSSSSSRAKSRVGSRQRGLHLLLQACGSSLGCSAPADPKVQQTPRAGAGSSTTCQAQLAACSSMQDA
jgi:hypothetical protein